MQAFNQNHFECLSPLEDPDLLGEFCQLVIKKIEKITKGIRPSCFFSVNYRGGIEPIIEWLDELLTKQVNSIIHHPHFQALESSWRGIAYLVNLILDDKITKVRILDVDAKTLTRDLDQAIEFDQSEIFRKIYTEEFDAPGGEPFGIIVGDYEVTPIRHINQKNILSIETIDKLIDVAEAAFAPVISTVHPSFLGLDQFSDLDKIRSMQSLYSLKEYANWQICRKKSGANFMGLVLPKFVMRKPYTNQSLKSCQFCFDEDMSLPKQNSYLWGSSAYYFASVVMNAFMTSGWFADIRGVKPGTRGAGLITDLVEIPYFSEATDLPRRPSLDASIAINFEKELNEMGFIVFHNCQYTGDASVYGVPSIKYYSIVDENTVSNSVQMQYIFSVSRISHYIKVIMRDKVGSFITADECQVYLQNWLMRYTANAEDLSMSARAKFPLNDAKVVVKEILGKPGCFLCNLYLKPQQQFDWIDAGLVFTTELGTMK